MLIVFNSIGDLTTRVDSFPFDGIDHVVWAFVAESHRILVKKLKVNS